MCKTCDRIEEMPLNVLVTFLNGTAEERYLFCDGRVIGIGDAEELLALHGDDVELQHT